MNDIAAWIQNQVSETSMGLIFMQINLWNDTHFLTNWLGDTPLFESRDPYALELWLSKYQSHIQKTKSDHACGRACKFSGIDREGQYFASKHADWFAHRSSCLRKYVVEDHTTCLVYENITKWQNFGWVRGCMIPVYSRGWFIKKQAECWGPNIDRTEKDRICRPCTAILCNVIQYSLKVFSYIWSIRDDLSATWAAK